MKKYIYISLSLIATLVWGCQRDNLQDLELESESGKSSCVEVLEDGQLLISGSLSGTTFGNVSVSTRAADINWTTLENNIVDGWCLVFGVDPNAAEEDEITDGVQYTTGSPLIQKVPLHLNANGLLYVTLTPYEGMAFLRVVVNMTDRENDTLSDDSIKCWADYNDAYMDDGETLREPTADDDLSGIATFGDYIDQSVGLDGIYDITYTTTIEDVTNKTETNYNKNQPSPLSPATAFPMSSVGFVLPGGITEDTVADVFGTTIYLIRTCSKVDVTVSTTEFLLKEVYLIDCAQESRVRSTVLTTSGTDGNETTTDFGVPTDLGGTISYLALEEEVSNDSELNGTDTDNTTSPIYIYPNSGGDYDSNDGAVDKTVNPQYIIIKGRAGRYFVPEFDTDPYIDDDGVSHESVTIPAEYAYGYDTDGYYKIALKAQYPLTYKYDDDGNIIQDEDGAFQVETWSDLTYDVLRNTHFNIELINVDKPGYKTYDDAIDPNNPATNISYNITIVGQDGRNEILVSNGTYSAELEASRIYAKGYTEFENSFQFTITPNDANDDYQHPAIYVMADYGVDVTGVSYISNNVSTEATKTDLEGTDYADDQDSNVGDYWYKVEESKYKTEVTIDYTATASGRLRLRIGDILKFIPVRFDGTAVVSEGGALSFSNESGTSFAYSQIEAVDTETYSDNTSILSSDGVVAANKGEARELRSKIYTDSGNAMLYFWQNKESDPGEQSTGNTINSESLGLESDVTLTVKDEDGVETNCRSDLADAVVDALTADYTTVYIEQTYEALVISSDGKSTDTDNVFNDIKDEITALIEADELPKDYTFSLDLSGMEREDYDTNPVYNTVFKHMAEGLFSYNTYISSLILPSSVYEIHSDSFYGCTNLMEVVIGSETDPAYDYDAVTNTGTNGRLEGNEYFILSNKSFRGMSVGCTITIYTTSPLLSYHTDRYTNFTYTEELTGGYYSVPIVPSDNTAPVYTMMPITKYVFTIDELILDK